MTVDPVTRNWAYLAQLGIYSPLVPPSIDDYPHSMGLESFPGNSCNKDFALKLPKEHYYTLLASQDAFLSAP